MMTNERLKPLLEQYDWATERLLTRLAGPTSNSGDDSDVDVPVLTDAEYLWEPVDACWSVRRRADGPGPGAIKLIGAGEWVTAPPKVRGLRPSRRSPGGLTTSPKRCWADPTTSGATERSIERRTNHDQMQPALSRGSVRPQPTGAGYYSVSMSPTMTGPG